MKNDPPKKSSSIEKRLLKGAVDIYQNPPEKVRVSYQHKVLAQTRLPYRNPGDDVKVWTRTSGDYGLMIEAGTALNPRTKQQVTPGIPYGPKARIIMIYLNQQAIKTGSPVIDVGESMTAFIKAMHGNKIVNGTVIKAYKEQLARLSSCYITLAVSLDDDHAINERSNFIKKFDLWFPRDAAQRVLWNSTIQLDSDYFQTLKNYLVPLDERAVGNLSHSAMALDMYAWLAQRLHWIKADNPQFVTWQNLKEQFGEGYSKMGKFKEVFRHTLQQVITQYPAARNKILEDDNKGFVLKQAAPPVPYSRARAIT